MTYPVEDINSNIAIDGLNYLLSGPSGLGQDFNGFSSFAPGWVTGNFRTPYTESSLANLYVAPITLSTSELLDPYTWKFTFASAQPSPPFVPGNGIYVSGVSDPIYDGFYNPIGVVQCTTTYVIARTQSAYTASGPGTGGFVLYSATNTGLNSTDCNSKITVTGGTDRVFITAQLNNVISYDYGAPSDLTYTVQINRYVGEPNTDPINPGFVFNFDKTVSQRIYTYTGLTGPGSLPNQETIFSTFFDSNIPPGYYWYILEVQFDSDAFLQVTASELGLRSMTTQVVKQ